MAATRKRASVSRGLQAGRTGLEGVREPGPARRPYTKRDLGVIYRALIEAYGPQQWWPTAADDGPEQRFEICLGTILVQNTAWRGAANALANLRGADATTPEAILDLPEPVLGELLRPSGYFNAKARKVRAFCAAVLDAGGIDVLLAGSVDEVRARLLALWGVGPETADAMTLYAGRKPTFVVDAYAYRLFERLGRPPGRRDYDTYRTYFLGKLGDEVWMLNQWHALVVRHGQQVCRRTAPQCEACVLEPRCEFARGGAEREES